MLTYGFDIGDLEEIRDRIEKVLKVQFRKHDSSFLGGDYYRSKGTDEEEMILFRNWDPVDKEPIQEPGACKAILRIERIDDAARAREVDAQLRKLFKDIRPVV